jgi:hypothetical protein
MTGPNNWNQGKRTLTPSQIEDIIARRRRQPSPVKPARPTAERRAKIGEGKPDPSLAGPKRRAT